VFGFAAHAATKGQRDFSSVRSLAASRYDVIARDGTAERARVMLSHAGLIPAEVPAEI
jgi:3,4-dihydroxy-2-butanone 4-phosphate synthase